MSTVPISKLSELQGNAHNLRNVCVLAHVDHGKTTLTDSLLSTNGIISSRLAGKVRYLDSRQDEQERGITMESSGVSLYFKVLDRSCPIPPTETKSLVGEPQKPQEFKCTEYLINLIDSPGHIDFSSEVSSASRLSDGALILIDVVEGVCTQTISVLRQAWLEEVKTVLVINKIDRLITELQMTPSEAYVHIQQLIEQANAVLAGFWESDRMASADKKLQKNKKQTEDSQEEPEHIADTLGKLSISTAEWSLEEKDDSHIYYDPSKGNVIFGSATDGWAFRTIDFAHILSKKMSLGTPEKLVQVLWGDFYLDPKNKKRVLTTKQFNKLYRSGGSFSYPNAQPLFVQLILSSIWKVYEAVVLSTDQEQIDKIITSLDLKINPRDRKIKDPKTLVSIIMRTWLPLAQTCMLSIVDQLPSPEKAQKIRIPALVKGKSNIKSGPIYNSLLSCDPQSPSVAYIGKMLAFPKAQLPENVVKSERLRLTAKEMRARGREHTPKPKETNESTNSSNDPTSQPRNESRGSESNLDSESGSKDFKDEEVLIGFARLYSGVLKTGDQVFCLDPRYKPKKPNSSNFRKAKILGLYIFMGSELVCVDKVYPGCIFGVRGLEKAISSSGTITSEIKGCPNLSPLHFEGAPIVRVAVEPANPANLPKLVEGLKILRDSDSCVRVEHNNSGEYILITAGELHLERCIKDLHERFAKCEINVSKPRVPFRETIVNAPGMPNALKILNGPGFGTLTSKYRALNTENKPSASLDKLSSPLLSEKEKLKSPVLESSVDQRGFISVFTPNKYAAVHLSVQPLNSDAISFLISSKSKLSHLFTKPRHSKHIDHKSKIPNKENKGDFVDGSSDLVSENHLPENSETVEETSLPESSLLDETNTFTIPELENLNESVKEEVSVEKKEKNKTVASNVAANSGKASDQKAEMLDTLKKMMKKDKFWEKRSQDLESLSVKSFGPHHSGPNVLFTRKTSNLSIFGHKINICDLSRKESTLDADNNHNSNEELFKIGENLQSNFNISTLVKHIEHAIDSGFQLATRSGPLCNEPTVGLACTIHQIDFNLDDKEDPAIIKSVLSTIYGQLISTVRDAIREAILMWSPRLMLAMFDCEIQSSADVLGKTYSVISRHKGRIVSEEIIEGTPYFKIQARIPVVESFGFTDEMRKRTSGGAQPLLVYSGFEMFDVDPFWVPNTEEELEDLGEIADHENLARVYMDGVRRSKGLFVERKIVTHAEKQRTLKR
ncbi:hypothetical protein BB560_003838 [Smittium megazygosporum]|uniref:Ribosome assembly protein 1 n=1 Tax=Smittium megazygosporum TaxID=133381 RepID=A0A2T9ZB02_9FUNG|nr:hypothetical protein BB560_003838 [Smittium megazygosporum]